jgi:hypothetical protein
MKIKFLIVCTIVILFNSEQYSQKEKYPTITKEQVILQGDSGSWDYNKVHTLSVVEANRDGYKYWGYYGLSYYGGDPSLRKAGLVRSNDLVNWTKYEGNPIIQGDCRWPTVVLADNVFYMFYAQYDANNDSRIVMLTSSDGIHFGDTTVVVQRELGTQNQNPFIFYNKQDGNFYLAYYHGVERSNDKPLVGREGINVKSDYKDVKNFWQIMLRKAKNIVDLKVSKPKLLLEFDYTLASPSIVYYKDKYYLLVESIKEGQWNDWWVTLAYASDKVDGGYKELANNPLLRDNDACAFQYVLDGELYIFYSHCLNMEEWNWDLRYVKAVK